VYNNVEDERQKRAFRLLNDVGDGIAGGHFQLLYQPKHDLANGACLSAEALLRWHHAELGPISPAEFIPLVEKTALIGPLSHWVMRTAIQQIGAWHAAGHAIKVAINLSAYNFEEPDLVARLSALCNTFGVDPRYVEIECTEGIWMEGAGILQTLHDIRALGMSLALDDFGTGYSNFAYLQKVPATVVKVDQSLIRDVHNNPRDQRIVRSLIGLAKELDYQVVAEGVETEQSLHLIRDWGCHIAQGYHFAKPLTATDFLDHAIRYRDARMAAAA
jgi:EAL domain-containing protein (putative c-di-GMP-specific phosphodiesterase class I)